MDVAEPPRIQLEGVGPCPSAARLEALLRSSMGAARAPATGWVVEMRVEKTTARALRAEGDITDDAGMPVARRVVSGSIADCDALARAVGVWASLVLDAERTRPAPVTAEAMAPDAPASASAKPDDGGVAADPSEAPPLAYRASPAMVSTQAPLESGLPGARAEGHTVEIGVGTFLMAGPRGRAFGGVTPYAVVETGHGLFLRPSLAVGEAFGPGSSSEPSTWSAARMDACWRVTGLYPTDHGLKFDICGGADGGLYSQSTEGGTVNAGSSSIAPFLSVGPSLELDGDLAGALSLVLRGAAGINILPDGWTGRVEVALSWRLR